MANYLGGYSLPYLYPLNYVVRYNTCGLISGLGNYAVGEVFENGANVHKFYYPNKDVFRDSYTRAMEMSNFLSNLTFDVLSKEEFDYIYNSDEYEFFAGILSMENSDFRESVRDKTLIKHISPYNKVAKRDSDGGILTGTPNKEFYLESIQFVKDASCLTVSYKFYGNPQILHRHIQLKPYFFKCFMSAVKFNILCDITKRRGYGHLTSGAFAFKGHTVNPFIDYYDKDYISELGYLSIL